MNNHVLMMTLVDEIKKTAQIVNENSPKLKAIINDIGNHEGYNDDRMLFLLGLVATLIDQNVKECVLIKSLVEEK